MALICNAASMNW